MLKSCYLLLPRLFRSFLQVSSTKELSLRVWRWSSVIMTPHDRTSWGFLKIFCITSPNRKSSENSSWLCNSVYYWVAFCLYRSLLKRKKISKQFLKFLKSEFLCKILMLSHQVFWHDPHKPVFNTQSMLDLMLQLDPNLYWSSSKYFIICTVKMQCLFLIKAGYTSYNTGKWTKKHPEPRRLETELDG